MLIQWTGPIVAGVALCALLLSPSCTLRECEFFNDCGPDGYCTDDGRCAPRPDLRPVEPGVSPVSGGLAIADDRLVVVAPDHDQVLIVDPDDHRVLRRVNVGDEPAHVLVVDEHALVTTRFSHSVEVIDIDTGERVRTIEVGVEPFGLSTVDDDRVAVALSGEAALAIVNHKTGEVERKIVLGATDPRAVAKLADGRLLVTHMSAGVVSAVDLSSGTSSTKDVATENRTGPELVPNHLRSITLLPDGGVLLPHSQANVDEVRAPIEPGEGDDRTSCGYGGCPERVDVPAYSSAITELDGASLDVVVPTASRRLPVVTSPPSVLNPNEQRFDFLAVNNPTAVALVDGGRALLVLHTGSRNLLLLKRQMNGTASDVLGVFHVGHGAQSLTLSASGRRAFVFNQFDGTVSEFVIPTVSLWLETGPIERFPVSTWHLIDDALPPQASEGRKLFHDATDQRVSDGRMISCATCHPDGRTDGMTWQFTFGPRNTPQLGGGILETAPFHWPGDVVTHRELNDLTVRAFMGGSGLDRWGMDAIGAWLDSVRSAPAPSALDAAPSDAALRGQILFDSPELGCIVCHAGPHGTDNKNWDLGTQATAADRADFQTPVLHGLARSAPYLHDGSMATLELLVDALVRTDVMGRGSHLTDDEAADLVAYLLTR